jgi:hypothetical protein
MIDRLLALALPYAERHPDAARRVSSVLKSTRDALVTLRDHVERGGEEELVTVAGVVFRTEAGSFEIAEDADELVIVSRAPDGAERSRIVLGRDGSARVNARNLCVVPEKIDLAEGVGVTGTASELVALAARVEAELERIKDAIARAEGGAN